MIERYDDRDADEWDALVARSWNGTFLHTRRFLGFHGDRFEDCSLLVRRDDGRLVAVLPAARDRVDPSQVVSHPGATYGGLVHDRDLQGAVLLESLQEVTASYRALGFRHLVYKPVPHVFHAVPAQDDIYALHRLGAVRHRCDLSSAVDLRNRPRRSARRLRNLARTRDAGIELSRDPASLESFWALLVDTLARRHSVAPAHAIDEMRDLMERFPEEIALVTGHLDGAIVAGAITFSTPSAVHSQYLASSDTGRAIGALELVVEECIVDATARGCSYFSFGISTTQDGSVVNQGLHVFKTKFGGGAVVHEHYTVAL